LQNDLSKDDEQIVIEAGPYAELDDIQGDDYYVCLIWNGSSYEYVHITAKLGENTVQVRRAQEGSAAIVGRVGDRLSIINTAGLYRGLNQSESAIQMNRNRVRADVTIPAGYNAHSVGPLDIEAVVSIEAGSVWSIE